MLARILWLLIACAASAQARAEAETPLTRLLDTGIPSAAPLTGEAIARQTRWALVPEDTLDHTFSGDIVLLNDKLAVVLRKQGPGAEVYTKSPGGPKWRATLRHVGPTSGKSDPLAALKVLENTASAVMVEATVQNPAAAALRFRLTTGEGILEIRSDEGAGFLHLLSRTACVLVPDYFGDDLLFGPDEFRGRCLPTENFCLNLLEGGDAIVMSVCQSSDPEIWLAEAEAGQDPALRSNRIRCVRDKSVWLAFLESPGLWHTRSGLAMDDWTPPFAAKWRCSFLRENGVADSWDLDRGPQPDQTVGQHRGPIVTYPIDRSATTPLTAVCPTDVMRNTLGVGPCQYILACEGLAAQGDPTPNSVMNWVEKQFEQKKDRKSAEDLKERLEQMTKHVAEARERIVRYGEFSSQTRQRLINQTGAEPFRLILDDLDRFVAAGSGPSASPDQAKRLADQVAALIGKGNSLAECQRFGVQLRSIGAVQDAALAKCRMAVRRLRQEGRSLGPHQTSGFSLPQEIQQLAAGMLRAKSPSPGKDANEKQ